MAQTQTMDLLSQAGWMAKAVLLILFGASVGCWTIIFVKWKQLKMMQRLNERFMESFWNGRNLEDILARSSKLAHSPLLGVFKNGVKELQKMSSPDSLSGLNKTDNIHRALSRAMSQEISQMENHIHWLATTASAAPFIGLFGTVWGIMNSFQSIGSSGAANLAIVAPGISEALVTTAMGIGTAIPAVVAYNYFAGRIKKLALEIECFCQDFLNILQRTILNESND